MKKHGLHTLLVLASFAGLATAQDRQERAAPDVRDETVLARATGLRFAVLASKIRRSIVSTDTPYGFAVEEVAADSPASAAGLRAGDVVLRWDGEELREIAAAADTVRDAEAGTELELRYARRDADARDRWSEHETTLTIPSAADEIERVLGVRFSVFLSKLRRSIVSTDTPYGFAVAEVAAGSPAAQAGLEAGDVVLEWNGTPIEELVDLRDAMRAADRGRVRFSRRARSFRRDPWETKRATVVLDADARAKAGAGKGK